MEWKWNLLESVPTNGKHLGSTLVQVLVMRIVLIQALGISKKGTIRTAWGPAHSTRQWVATVLDVEQQGMFEYVPEENRVIDSPLTVASSTKLGP